MIFNYDKIYYHKFPVIKYAISADRKTRKITSLRNAPKWNNLSVYMLPQNNFNTNSRRKVQHLRIKFTKLRF